MEDQTPAFSRMSNRRKLRRKRRKMLVSEVLQDFAKNTTLHGLRYTTEKGLTIIEKSFWILTFIISLCLCLFLIRNVYWKWKTSPVIVSLSEQLVSVQEVPFPSVMICPQQKIKQSVYNFTNETIGIEQNQINIYTSLSLDVPDNYSTAYKFEDISMICNQEDENALALREYADYEIIENLYDVAPKVSDFMEECYWHGDMESCEDLFTEVWTSEGLCYTFNSLATNELIRNESVQHEYLYLNTTRQSESWSLTDGYHHYDQNAYPRRGKGNGAVPDLQVVLFENLPDRDPLCNGLNRGYKIYLQHPADMPQSSLYYYAALPQQLSSFALKFSVLNTSDSLRDYPAETRQCYFPLERELHYFKTYTPSNCRLECLSNYTFERCGCVWFNMPHNDSTRICRNIQRDCVIKAINSYGAQEGLMINGTTDQCKCLPSCISIQYDAEILKTQFAAKSFLKTAAIVSDQVYGSILKEFSKDMGFNYSFTDDYKGKEQSYSKIEMYFKEPRFVSMRRSELFGVTDFLANCGGLLGLFLGFSFLSLVEIFYFCTLRLSCILRRDMLNEKKEKEMEKEP